MVWLYNCCVLFKNSEGGNSRPFPGEGDKFFTLVGRRDKREGGRLRKKEMERLIQVIEHDLVIPEVLRTERPSYHFLAVPQRFSLCYLCLCQAFQKLRLHVP